MLKLLNTKSTPQIYYGLHMVPGVAEYSETNTRVYLSQDTIKAMNPSFQGKPVYVEHVEEVDPNDLEKDKELDGVVVRSFFNSVDGNTWAEFVVFTDQGKQAIRQGWKLSNCYLPLGYAKGGENHAVQYDKEVTSAEYEHLAIVPNPRYEESVILTPEEFKRYNEEKEAELIRLANSKEPKEKKAMALKLNIFKRTKVENGKDGIDLAGLMVELPTAKTEMLLTDVVEQFDKIQNMQGYANGDHMVKIGEDEMSVNDLIKKHVEMCNEMSELKKEPVENADGDGDADDAVENESEESDEESVENESEESEEKEKKKNAKAKADEEAAKKVAAKKKAEALKNARATAENEETAVVDLTMDRVARGKSRYGSN